jgi:hypothetical protein
MLSAKRRYKTKSVAQPPLAVIQRSVATKGLFSILSEFIAAPYF